MINRNAGRSDDALECYKAVVAQGGEYAEDALLAIEAIYRTREDPEAYLAYVNSLGGAGRTEAQKEEVYFSSAEQIYLSGDYAKAQATLQAYLEKYPQAIYGAKAKFYLADCYRCRAAGAGRRPVPKRPGRRSGRRPGESALLQLASLSYEMGSYAKAYGAYLKLKEWPRWTPTANWPIGLMRSAFRARQWDDAIPDAASGGCLQGCRPAAGGPLCAGQVLPEHQPPRRGLRGIPAAGPGPFHRRRAQRPPISLSRTSTTAASSRASRRRCTALRRKPAARTTGWPRPSSCWEMLCRTGQPRPGKGHFRKHPFRLYLHRYPGRRTGPGGTQTP